MSTSALTPQDQVPMNNTAALTCCGDNFSLEFGPLFKLATLVAYVAVAVFAIMEAQYLIAAIATGLATFAIYAYCKSEAAFQTSSATQESPVPQPEPPIASTQTLATPPFITITETSASPRSPPATTRQRPEPFVFGTRDLSPPGNSPTSPLTPVSLRIEQLQDNASLRESMETSDSTSSTSYNPMSRSPSERNMDALDLAISTAPFDTTFHTSDTGGSVVPAIKHHLRGSASPISSVRQDAALHPTEGSADSDADSVIEHNVDSDTELTLSAGSSSYSQSAEDSSENISSDE